MSKTELIAQKFTCLAGPFLQYEEPMIPAFIEDARMANKDVVLQKTPKGTFIWQRRKNIGG